MTQYGSVISDREQNVTRRLSECGDELLKKEIELLKKEAKAKPDGPKAKSQTKVSVGKGDRVVEYELVKCARNSTKRTRVTFTFAAQSESGKVFPIGICQSLKIITGGGKAVEGRVVAGPGAVPGKELDDVVYLTKGGWKKFQVTYEGVDEDITELDQVELIMGPPLGFARQPVTFQGIKIESK